MEERRFANLADDALHAIAGADTVRYKLLSYIESGACGLKAECYAIKARTKDPASLAEKVRNRRTEKPEYNAIDARDIVGLRLLALHYASMRNICENLVDFFSFGLQSSVDLFVGSSLGEMIEEVIVYSAPGSGLIYRDIFEMFRSMNLGNRPNGKPKVEYKQYQEDRPYSSIHIVCHAVGSSITERPFIPIEIQVRTTLEDTWAEVDHQLKYKNKKENSDFPISTDRLFTNFKSTIDSALGALDGIIDIHRQIDFEQRRRSGGHLPRTLSRLDIDHIVSERAPKSIHEEAIQLNTKVDEFVESLERAKFVDEKLLAKGELIEAKILKLRERYSKHSVFSEDQDFYYWSGMEIGLINAWLYRASVHGPFDAERRLRYIVKAIATYEELEKTFPHDAWLLFRLSTAMMLDDLVDLAIEREEEAYRHLAKDRRLAGNDVLKGVVARQLGFFYWLKKHKIWYGGRKSGAAWLAQRQEKPLVQRAYEVTSEALRLILGSKASDRRTISIAPTMSNLSCYAWEMREIYRTETGINETAGHAKLMDEILASENFDKEMNTSRIDTLMKMSHLRGNIQLARSLAQKILSRQSREKENIDDSEFLDYCAEVVLNSTKETS